MLRRPRTHGSLETQLADGVTPDDIVGVLRAVAPQVGGPKVVAAAPEIMVALGLDIGGVG